MKQGRAFLAAPFFLDLLAVAFCLWIAFGNDVNFCVTTGCTLYQDFSFFGISLWWYGAAAFGLLVLCALPGFGALGHFFAACFLLADTGFLILMALTAPCVSCLAAAAFFALSFILFRRGAGIRGAASRPLRSSILIWVWLAFFVINLGAVGRSQFEIWPILDESGDARTRMFFSPSCSHCIDGINALSGNVETAFYPVADTDDDIYRIARIQELLNEGLSLKEAVARAREVQQPDFWGQFAPETLLLRWRLLGNKAHILASNSGGVPFFEERGLPSCLREKKEDAGKEERRNAAPSAAPANTDPTLPIDDGGQCAPGVPCP